MQAILNSIPSSIVSSVTDAIAGSIADTVNSQGVIAAFAKPVSQPSNLLIGSSTKSGLFVLLDRPADPGNVGTLIRTAFGLGGDAVIVADGCDPWSPKALRAAMGLCLQMPIFESTWKEIPPLLTKLSTHSSSALQVLIADADTQGSIRYSQVDMTKPTLLIIGSEATGVGSEARGLAGAANIHIPTLRNLESLNAAIAGAIILGEASRQRLDDSKMHSRSPESHKVESRKKK
jgi:TrmH family RNA methyltransferase